MTILVVDGDRQYDSASVKQLNVFLWRCSRHLKSESNLFWVALQSNQVADIDDVQNDFKEALENMKNDLATNGWIFPQLESNMRNQINISNITVDGSQSGMHMQSSIDILKSGTNVVGEIPTLYKVERSWDKKERKILKHCIDEMNAKDKKNIVILYDRDAMFKEVAIDLKNIIQDKTIVEYPSSQGKQKGVANIKDFIEKDNHVLFTQKQYFNGCEASNVIFLNDDMVGVRNCLMRAVKNVICIQAGGSQTKISGMKEDHRFN